MPNYRVMIEIDVGACDNAETAAQVAVDDLKRRFAPAQNLREERGVYMHVHDIDTSWSVSGIVQVADDGDVDSKDLS